MRMTDPIGVIYFMQPLIGGPVKIGFTTNLHDRLRQLQNKCPFAMCTLAAYPTVSGLVEEAGIKAALRPFKRHGEWFHAVPEVIALVEAAGGHVLPVDPGGVQRTEFAPSISVGLNEFRLWFARTDPCPPPRERHDTVLVPQCEIDAAITERMADVVGYSPAKEGR